MGQRGATHRGEPRGEIPLLRALCGPDGPAALPDVLNHREAGKKPVRASGSETGIFKPQGPPWGNRCANPGLNTSPPAAPDPAEPGRSRS